jgi:hypothetical protein
VSSPPGPSGLPGKPADEGKLTQALDVAQRVEPWLGWLWPMAAGVLGVSTGGVAGLGIWGLRALLRLRRRGAVPAPPGGPAPPPAANPVVPPALRETENVYVPYAETLEGEAYREALRREAKLNEQNNPGVVPFLERVDATAKEILRGLHVKASKPGWKPD